MIKYYLAGIFLSATIAMASFDSLTFEADRLNDDGYTKSANLKYKEAYAQANNKQELIKTFAALAVTSSRLGYRYDAGSYADRLRTIDPQNSWVKRFFRTYDVEVPHNIRLINGETHLNQMRSGDMAYKNGYHDEAYIDYLRGLSTCTTRDQLIVSLASLAVASHDSGRKREAKIYLQRLLKISPDNQWAIEYTYKINGGNIQSRASESYASTDSSDCSEKPLLACSPSEADAKSIAMCATVMGGCEAIQGDMTTEERYLADQTCNAITNELMGERNTLDSMLYTAMGTAISGAAKDARNSDNPLINLVFGVSLTVTELAYKESVFEMCRSKARQNCQRIYAKWQRSCR